jgi:hypothetical protein
VRDIEALIDALLGRWPDGFRNKHMAQALGVSRSRVSQLLAPRVLSGELARKRSGRRGYIRGLNHRDTPGAGARGALANSFWKQLVQESPQVAYVALSRLGLTDLRTRRQIRDAVRGLPYEKHFLLVDFEGVQSISPAAANELLFKVSYYKLIPIQPINVEPAVARTLWHVRHLGDR